MSVYSNFDHKLDEQKVTYLKENPGKQSQHAASDFCGYIKWNGKCWVNKIMRYHAIVEEIHGKNIMNVINEANEKYGSG